MSHKNIELLSKNAIPKSLIKKLAKTNYNCPPSEVWTFTVLCV